MTAGATPPAKSSDAKRSQRYRERKKSGVRMIDLPVSGQAIQALTEMGFLAAGRREDKDIVLAWYVLLNAARAIRPDILSAARDVVDRNA
jgi:hypothetical protein